jgi:putative addiction module component (TIGR02574 family)
MYAAYSNAARPRQQALWPVYNGTMPRDAADLLRDALTLPAEARAALADSLLESLDVQVDEDAEVSWREEIHRRLTELDSGAVKLIPWDEARRRLWGRLPG